MHPQYNKKNREEEKAKRLSYFLFLFTKLQDRDLFLAKESILQRFLHETLTCLFQKSDVVSAIVLRDVKKGKTRIEFFETLVARTVAAATLNEIFSNLFPQ